MTNIGTWLDKIGLGKHTETFLENDIDFDILEYLNENDLEKIGIKSLGDRKRLLKALRLQADPGSASSTPSAPSHPLETPQSSEAERRQLTLMFVDLVGSTALSTQIDPEDMSKVIREFQNMVAGEVSRFDGYVAKFMGDGVLIYFGWPSALEDAGERSIRAAISISRLTALQHSEVGELACRIGIATGLVVVGELIGEGDAQEKMVVGETPNLAARLQGIARPGEIVISETTKNLVGTTFELASCGDVVLKGIAPGTQAYKVIAERTVESRFEARSMGSLNEMVGRDHELGIVLDRWSQAQDGEGQLVLLVGEAGIGKSRVSRAIIERVKQTEHTRISYQCSPYHTDSTLYPAIQQLKFVANLSDGDSNDDKLDKLESVLLGEDIQAIANLLELETENRYGPLNLDALQLRWRMLRGLTDELMQLSESKPVLFILEDAHWIDATTLEMIDLCLDQLEKRRILILVTARPTFVHRFSGHPALTQLTLNRLGREQTSSIATKLAGGKQLPVELLDEIAKKTDGVPLFVEELTKTILESQKLQETKDAYVLTGPVSLLAIPVTLHDSLMARLDRMQPVKEVAQMASCIGREFDLALLIEISNLTRDDLVSALGRLVTAELIFHRGLSADGFYIFKHALVRDAAHESLLKTRRKTIHMKLLNLLEHVDGTAPEVLASHAVHAEEITKAVDYWQLAGEQAQQRNAVFEAVAHFRNARNLLIEQPRSAVRDERELELLKLLGGVSLAAYGYGANETIEAFKAGFALTETVHRPDLLFPILYGQYVYRYIQGGGNQPAHLAARKILQEAEKYDVNTPRMVGHRCVGMTLFSRGEFSAARPHFEKALDYYRTGVDDNLILEYGTDSRVSAQAFLSTLSLLSGFPDKAHSICADSISIARQTKQVHNLEYALFFGPIRLSFCLRDVARFETLVAELSQVAEENRLPMWKAYAATQKGWLLSQHGHHADAVKVLENGIRELEACGVKYDTALAWGQLAEVHLRAKSNKEGLVAVDQAMLAVTQTNERWFEPEIFRLQGELLLQCGQGRIDDARTAFHTSVACANKMQARWWELRTTVSMTRQGKSPGSEKENIIRLNSLYAEFSEGKDTPDLLEARQALEANKGVLQRISSTL
ncbi:MAG: class 3 adenylate cyclase/predicted ATPase [Gammaproteobacteria bacterium]|jgi:class 3 adenylate cyclase/predicted ATPase